METSERVRSEGKAGARRGVRGKRRRRKVKREEERSGWEEDLQVKRCQRRSRESREGSSDEAAADKKGNDECTASLNGQLPRLG